MEGQASVWAVHWQVGFVDYFFVMFGLTLDIVALVCGLCRLVFASWVGGLRTLFGLCTGL